MSIQDFQPLITQTPERTSSGEASSATSRDHLGRMGVRGAVYTDGEVAAISYLPNHESLQFGIDHIYSVVFVELEREFTEVTREINRIDREIGECAERQHALEEYRADLDLFGRTARATDRDLEVPQAIQALEHAKNALTAQREDIAARRVSALIELEKLERADFSLL